MNTDETTPKLREFGENRMLSRFRRLADGIEQGGLDETWLRVIESADNLFPTIDYRRYA